MTQVGSAPSWMNANYLTSLLNKADKDHNGLSEAELNNAISSTSGNTSEKQGYQYIKTNLSNISKGDNFVSKNDWLNFQSTGVFGTKQKKSGSSETDSGTTETKPAGSTSQDAGNPFQVISL